MRISDWSSDVCSSDLCVVAELTGLAQHGRGGLFPIRGGVLVLGTGQAQGVLGGVRIRARSHGSHNRESRDLGPLDVRSPIWWTLDDHSSCTCHPGDTRPPQSEEHTSELQSLMSIQYAVYCLKKKTQK